MSEEKKGPKPKPGPMDTFPSLSMLPDMNLTKPAFVAADGTLVENM